MISEASSRATCLRATSIYWRNCSDLHKYMAQLWRDWWRNWRQLAQLAKASEHSHAISCATHNPSSRQLRQSRRVTAHAHQLQENIVTTSANREDPYIETLTIMLGRLAREAARQSPVSVVSVGDNAFQVMLKLDGTYTGTEALERATRMARWLDAALLFAARPPALLRSTDADTAPPESGVGDLLIALGSEEDADR